MSALADSSIRVVRVYSEKRGCNLGYRDNRSFGGPREMHDAVCSNCGNPCQVPFQPRLGDDGKPVKPIYCNNCFKTMKTA